jgi:hypothetical protein
MPRKHVTDSVEQFDPVDRLRPGFDVWQVNSATLQGRIIPASPATQPFHLSVKRLHPYAKCVGFGLTATIVLRGGKRVSVQTCRCRFLLEFAQRRFVLLPHPNFRPLLGR